MVGELADMSEPGTVTETLRAIAPHALIVAITPFGLDSPWRGRPSNEFVLQALAGGAWSHGRAAGPPTMCGGNTADYAVGTAAAIGLLVGRIRTMSTGL